MTETSNILAPQYAETRVETYRTLSLSALFCLGMGILSVTAMAHPVFWLLPVFAVLSGVVALRSIRRSEGELTGETAATAGLTLGVVFFLAGLGVFFIPRWQGRRDATNLGIRYLQYLQTGDTPRAMNLTEPPGFRVPENVNFEEAISKSRKSRKSLSRFKENQPIVEKLGKLGGRAQINPYNIEVFGTIEGELGAHVVYLVDFTTESNQSHQFLVMVHCVYRRNVKNPREGGWFIRKVEGPPYVPYSARVRETAAHQHDGPGGGEHDHEH